ncbi:hypothetical protein F2P56_012710 [Juglans regia]|uniref:Uncharacterized protein n=2 Tax=Juglans regia TaxID=51240 RepID=A0A833XML3_JUGRE|nr:uncharacterized protein LOC108994526 [Juglans regia]KAF5468567.1 hypothetical protein F2P56_012710 [Juglans regia]
MSDKEIAFYAKKFKKMFVTRNKKNQRQEKKKFERYNRDSSSRNKEISSKKYTSANKNKMQSKKMAKERAKIASLSESESESSDSSKNSSPKRNINYMTFTSTIGDKIQCSEQMSNDGSISRNESGYED